jgi:23S rRNA (cytidine1920-2'-O)/16S rRNA (cytidine1409-2'-O)-methyltransferase
MKHFRLDSFLVDKGISLSREKAKKEILAGWVKINGETVRDVSRKIIGQEDILVERPAGLFASRGGEKLKKALDYFNISVSGLIAADLGASTGGFTDCLLKAGALKVYAVDVGYGQLDYTLQRDSRVIVMDRTNVRKLSMDDFSEKPDFITIDLSFISLTKIVDVLKTVFDNCEGVMLIKPQFEAEKSEQKKGVVKNPEIHSKILYRTLQVIGANGISIKGLTFSPIKGPAGNIEFLLYFSVDSQNHINHIEDKNRRGRVCLSTKDNRLSIEDNQLPIGEDQLQKMIAETVEEAHRVVLCK